MNVIKNACSSLNTTPYSDLYFMIESANWSLNWDQKELLNIANGLKIPSKIAQDFGIMRQFIFYNSKYVLLKPNYYFFGNNKIGFPYFHGYPSSGDQIAIDCFNSLKKHHEKIHRIQVSHSTMKDIILESGIDPLKVFQIPIAINPDFFFSQSSNSKRKYRKIYNIPEQAIVVGSFQKDGNGWGEGNEPKLIKGPDIFLKTVALLKKTVPELFVLLSGPARGYVKKGLEKLNISYKHFFLEHYPEVGKLFQCLDIYIVPSREEGGPKAILESMISGVPLITTCVGQAEDLVIHGENACMVDPEDFEGLSFWAQKILSDTLFKDSLIKKGLETAIANTYSSHLPLWKEFFKGFIDTV